MSEFEWIRDYDPEFELRDWGSLVRNVQRPSRGLFRPVLGGRRSGKTWALHAVKEHIGDQAQVRDLGPRLSGNSIERKISVVADGCTLVIGSTRAPYPTKRPARAGHEAPGNGAAAQRALMDNGNPKKRPHAAPSSNADQLSRN